MAYPVYAISKLHFEHIKSGGPCPCSDRLISEMQSFHSSVHINQDNFAQFLVKALDQCHGTEEIVSSRRKVYTMHAYMQNAANNDMVNMFIGGSKGEGFEIPGSDSDIMSIFTSTVVTYPDQMHLIPRHSLNKTILLMREADSRPGYVTLELSQIANGEGRTAVFQNAIVPFRDTFFVSSDIYRQGIVDIMNATEAVAVSNGPCCTLVGHLMYEDHASAFPCVCWPREANEWIHRTRLHGWPTQTMIDRIVQNGCHVVPVGDKCSTETLLQWRISFACAEQLLVHSLTHPQFRVYGLLKYVLSQIKDLLQHRIGDSDILCSYFLKTVIFYAVEQSSSLFWHDKHTFLCFRFCLSILIAWVKSGYCPNYFIRNNNLFLRKVHGENRQQLLHFLKDFYNLKWICLSIESVNEPYIGVMLQQHQRLTRQILEFLRDMDLLAICPELQKSPARGLNASLKCLYVARTDVDEFIAYYAMVSTLCNKACGLFNEYNTARNNKHKHIALKKCKQLLTPAASMCTSPGLAMLATFHYLTGDYRKNLHICADMLSTFFPFDKYYPRNIELYQRLYYGKGNTLYHKSKCVSAFVYLMKGNLMLCPPHLHLEIAKHPFGLIIPPLPYATFLSFLCYHELGDIRRRDTELINLRAANYDLKQGGHKYGIVHTLLGICYQIVGDNRRAIRSFTDSLRVMPEWNAAVERIEALRRYQ